MSLLEDEKKAEERERTIANERAKVSATYLNGLAIAVAAIGFLSPAFAPRSASPPTPEALQLQAIVALLCIALSAVLHIGARLTLGGIR